MKKLLSAFLAVSVVFGGAVPLTVNPQNYAISASAANEYTEGTYDVLTYKNYGDHIEISGCDESAEKVVIPSEIDGVPVTSIGDEAFQECTRLTSITIPDSVTSIGGLAFQACIRLTSITIPDSVTSIGYDAFASCLALTSITIPDSVTNIEGGAFRWCSGLTSIIVPSNVTSIGDYVFYGCSGLASVTIPNSVTSIGNSAFYGCSGLTSITIPDSVTNIGLAAFIWCSNLTSVTIENFACEIYDEKATISNGYDSEYYFNGTIHGYENSTAQAYAEKYSYKFESLGAAHETIWGDANESGKADMDDVVAILCAASGISTLSEQGALNADIYQNGDGVSSNDAVSLQKYLALTISELPESYLK